jgi:hypothetical protein
LPRANQPVNGVKYVFSRVVTKTQRTAGRACGIALPFIP